MMQPGDTDVVRSHGERQAKVKHCAQLHLVCFRYLYIVIGGTGAIVGPIWLSKVFTPYFLHSLAGTYGRSVLVPIQ